MMDLWVPNANCQLPLKIETKEVLVLDLGVGRCFWVIHNLCIAIRPRGVKQLYQFVDQLSLSLFNLALKFF